MAERQRGLNLNVRVTEEEARMVKALAEHRGLSVSDVIRQYIRAAFAVAFPPKNAGGPAPTRRKSACSWPPPRNLRRPTPICSRCPRASARKSWAAASSCPRPRLPNTTSSKGGWICEVLSPSNAAQDRVRKRRLYAARGVPFYWIVDPAARLLEALRIVTTGDRVEWNEIGVYDDDDTSIARIAPFDAIELEVGRLFPPAPATE